MNASPLTYLQRLEAESVHILREAVAESERPVMLYSIGKDNRCNPVAGRHAASHHRGNYAGAHLGAPWPCDRPRQRGINGEEKAGGLFLMQPCLLRFITCGSVDDGKSTLIGRLLYDATLMFDDHLAAMEAESRKWGTQGGQPDLALLLDGLAAEREQGITLDVAYRFFATAQRKFIVADTPDHEIVTRLSGLVTKVIEQGDCPNGVQ